MNFAKGHVRAKGIPRGGTIGFLISENEAFGSRIGHKEKFPGIQTEYLRKLGNNLFGRMALFCFKMADIRNGRSDPTGKLLLGHVELASACTNHGAKSFNAGRFHILNPPRNESTNHLEHTAHYRRKGMTRIH